MSDQPGVTVTADIVVILRTQQLRQNSLEHVLLVQRRNPPFQHIWALPGGKLKPGEESIETCALRELIEETGIRDVELTRLVGVYSRPDRDPRGHFISIAFLVELFCPPVLIAGDDAERVEWFPLASVPRDLPPLAFEHQHIVFDALMRMSGVLPL